MRSIDTSAAILEVAVHVGFTVLDTLPNRFTSVEIPEEPIRAVKPTIHSG